MAFLGLRWTLGRTRGSGCYGSACVCPSASRLGYVQNPFDKHLTGYSPHMCRRSYAGAAAHVLKNPYLVKALQAHRQPSIDKLVAEAGEWGIKEVASCQRPSVGASRIHGIRSFSPRNAKRHEYHQ